MEHQLGRSVDRTAVSHWTNLNKTTPTITQQNVQSLYTCSSDMDYKLRNDESFSLYFGASYLSEVHPEKLTELFLLQSMSYDIHTFT